MIQKPRPLKDVHWTSSRKGNGETLELRTREYVELHPVSTAQVNDAQCKQSSFSGLWFPDFWSSFNIHQPISIFSSFCQPRSFFCFQMASSAKIRSSEHWTELTKSSPSGVGVVHFLAETNVSSHKGRLVSLPKRLRFERNTPETVICFFLILQLIIWGSLPPQQQNHLTLKRKIQGWLSDL